MWIAEVSFKMLLSAPRLRAQGSMHIRKTLTITTTRPCRRI